MAIPGFQSIMLPLLQHLADGGERNNADTLEALARHFNVTTEEREQLLPSGRTAVFTNRVAWAKAHLKAAGLIESPRRAVYRLAPRGREVLNGNPSRVDLKLLKTFPEYQSFRSSKKIANTDGLLVDTDQSSRDDDDLTPEEHIEYGNQRLREELASELLDQLKAASPAFFERVVVDVLVAMGYGGSRADAGKTLGRAGDGGVDGVINEDRLGLDVIYVQAKRWDGTVGRPEIQRFAGALQGQRARKGVLITTSAFSREAEEYVGHIETRIVLINGATLAKLMIDHDVGVSTVAAYQVKRLDSDFFEEAGT
jgi:restriction system protein